MTGYRNLELPADRLAPRRARHEVRDLLAAEDRPDSVASLLVTELVTNAVRHVTEENGATVRVNLEVRAGRLRVEVVDEGAGFDLTDAVDTSDGYGLLIVERLADGWGVVSGPPHRVWCELTV